MGIIEESFFSRKSPLDIRQEPVSTGWIFAHTRVADVTPNSYLKQEAMCIAAESYSLLAKPPRNPDFVYQELCLDNYEINGRSRWIATIMDSESDNDLRTVTGTVRLVLGGSSQEGMPSLDALNFYQVSNWQESLGELSESQVGELGRFSVAEDFRYNPVREFLTGLLFQEAARTANGLGVQRLYAIMPGYVVRTTRDAGIGSVEVAGAFLTKSEEYQRLASLYPRYWKKEPKFYQFT